MKAGQFNRVANNIEKGQAYQQQIERLNLARAQGFYFECIFILYALMEDRLSSFLFHAGVTNKTRLKITTNLQVRPGLARIIQLDEVEMPQLTFINSKIKLVRQILAWSRTYTVESAREIYPDVLCGQIAKTQLVEETIDLLVAIDTWRDARNELVHALLNRSPADMDAQLQALTDEGYRCWRGLNRFMNAFNDNNNIRRKFNIQ